jgi:hypothetical protein
VQNATLLLLLQMLHHTWFEAAWERKDAQQQCQGSASMHPADIAASRSDVSA